MADQSRMNPRLASRAFDLPLERPFRIAYDTVTHARNVLTTATDGEQAGFGEGAPVPTITGETQEAVLADVDGPCTSLAGRCAAESARLDLAARQGDEPLCTHLRGVAPAAVATSITVPIVSADEAEALAKERLGQGFEIFKVKAGDGMDNDLARIERVREAIGNRELRLDPNQAWSRDEAKAVLPTLCDLGIEMLEQPLDKADLKGHAMLRAQEQLPIMLDESVFSPDDARAAIAAGACDQINIKLQKSAGPLPALEIADIAAEAGLPCMVGCMLESRVAILHAAHVVAAHPNIGKADLDGAFLLAIDPVDGGPRVEDGVLRLRGDAGLGVAAVRHE